MTQPTVAIESFETKSRPNCQNEGHNTEVTPNATKANDNATLIKVESGKAEDLQVVGLPS